MNVVKCHREMSSLAEQILLEKLEGGGENQSRWQPAVSATQERMQS